jgi:hypothetical protein
MSGRVKPCEAERRAAGAEPLVANRRGCGSLSSRNPSDGEPSSARSCQIAVASASPIGTRIDDVESSIQSPSVVR